MSIFVYGGSMEDNDDYAQQTVYDTAIDKGIAIVNVAKNIMWPIPIELIYKETYIASGSSLVLVNSTIDFDLTSVNGLNLVGSQEQSDEGDELLRCLLKYCESIKP